MPSESTLQSFIVKLCGKYGVLCYKFSSPSRRGVPDLLLLCEGRVLFIEVKNPNGKGRLSPLQEIEIDRLSRNGFAVEVIDSKEYATETVRAFAGQPA